MFTQNKYKDIPVKTKAIFLYSTIERLNTVAIKFFVMYDIWMTLTLRGLLRFTFSNEEHNHQDTFQHC